MIRNGRHRSVSRARLCSTRIDPRLIRSLLSRLPYPLALVLKEYIDQPNPYVKLHRLFNAAEMALRFF
jgi:hypothetical protein